MQLVERPAAEKRKIHSSNDFELCYLRHQYFRRAKYNPSAEDMAPYKKIIGYLSQRTFYTYPGLFHVVGMTLEDVQVVGSVQLVSFLGLFEIEAKRNPEDYENFCTVFERRNDRKPNADELLGKNKAIFTLFLKQRMEDLVRVSRQKAKNIKGSRVDEYIPFYGAPPPPDDLYKLLIDNEAYQYYRCDINQYKAIRKRAKKKVGEIFQWAGDYYVTVPLDHRALTVLDLQGAGMDPYESLHNLNPEEILFRRESEIRFDKRVKKYKNSSKEEKAKTILDFVEKNSNNPNYQDEIVTARKLLRNMGVFGGETIRRGP